MPPKKTKMSLGEFLKDDSYGATSSWGDDDLPAAFSAPPPLSGGSRNEWTVRDDPSDRYSRDSVPVPDDPPFTARLQNLDYDADESQISEVFGEPLKVVSVRVPRDNATGRIRGYAFVEFGDKHSLEEALKVDGTTLLNRVLRVSVAERRDDGWDGPRREDDGRDYDNWDRRGPLPPGEGDRPRRRADLPPDDRDYGHWDRRGPASPLDDEPRFRRDRAPPPDDDRDYGNWERRGPPPVAEGAGRRQPSGSRFGAEDEKDRDFDNWERRGPVAPRARREPPPPTEADNINDWRTAPRASPSESRRVSSGGARKRLELKPRTVGAHGSVPDAAESRPSSLFGVAQPVDTTQKLQAAEEKHNREEQERAEADRKRREDKKRTSDARAEQMRRRFEVLTTEEPKEAAGEAKEAAPAADAPVTEASAVEATEGSTAEPEDGDWNVVKRAGRK